MKTPISILHPRMTRFVLQRSNSHATRGGRGISGKASYAAGLTWLLAPIEAVCSMDAPSPQGKSFPQIQP
jgi:hypothetical protein